MEKGTPTNRMGKQTPINNDKEIKKSRKKKESTFTQMFVSHNNESEKLDFGIDNFEA